MERWERREVVKMSFFREFIMTGNCGENSFFNVALV